MQSMDHSPPVPAGTSVWEDTQVFLLENQWISLESLVLQARHWLSESPSENCVEPFPELPFAGCKIPLPTPTFSPDLLDHGSQNGVGCGKRAQRTPGRRQKRVEWGITLSRDLPACWELHPPGLIRVPPDHPASAARYPPW